MRVSVVINSAALGTRSARVLSSGHLPHGQRAELLRKQILPTVLAHRAVDEVVIVGEWEEGAGYRYVPSPSTRFDCTDALAQRAAGFASCHGDVVLFQHDDHAAQSECLDVLVRKYVPERTWDVLVPRRMAMDGSTPRVLNNGADEGYVMGHACVMRRAIAEAVPWTRAPAVFTWDVAYTGLLRARDARVRWVDDLVVWDLEAELGATPWK
jgi:hypothetical protein